MTHGFTTDLIYQLFTAPIELPEGSAKHVCRYATADNPFENCACSLATTIITSLPGSSPMGYGPPSCDWCTKRLEQLLKIPENLERLYHCSRSSHYLEKPMRPECLQRCCALMSEILTGVYRTSPPLPCPPDQCMCREVEPFMEMVLHRYGFCSRYNFESHKIEGCVCNYIEAIQKAHVQWTPVQNHCEKCTVAEQREVPVLPSLPTYQLPPPLPPMPSSPLTPATVQMSSWGFETDTASSPTAANLFLLELGLQPQRMVNENPFAFPNAKRQKMEV